MEQFKIVKVGKDEFFIDAAGIWYKRMPASLGAFPSIKFGLPDRVQIPFGPPQNGALIRPRGTRPNERGQSQSQASSQNQSQDEDIVLQEMGKPKVTFLENIAKSIQNVGTAIGEFKKVGRPTNPPNRNVITQRQKPINSKDAKPAGDFFSELSTNQKAIGLGVILVVGGIILKNKKKSSGAASTTAASKQKRRKKKKRSNS